MDDIFSITRTYSALSIQDLLSARDQYHYQLMNKENVIATAIGYYRIRKVEHWPSKTNKNPDNVKNLYEKHPNDFIPSFTIDQIKTVL